MHFAVRDADNRSHILHAVLEVDGDKGPTVREVSTSPVLQPGRIGCFDDSGVTPGCVVRQEGRYCLYYLGWFLSTPAPFQCAIGLAVGEGPAGPFTRVHEAPVLGRNPVDPISLSYPYVEHTGDGWRMIYGSHLEWTEEKGGMRHVLREAHSPDGVNWVARADALVGLTKGEWGLSRPWLVTVEGREVMLYAQRRPQGYTLGAAMKGADEGWERSVDAIRFDGPLSAIERKDQTYPSILQTKEETYLLYNGDGYGRAGVCSARLVSASFD